MTETFEQIPFSAANLPKTRNRGAHVCSCWIIPCQCEATLRELRYEVERGMLQHEIDERLRFRSSSRSVAPFATALWSVNSTPSPASRHLILDGEIEPRLRVIKGANP